MTRVAATGRVRNLCDASDLPGLAAWYRADQLIGFEQGTTNVIQEWGDISGNGRHLFQPISASRPILTTLTNRRPAMLFDGTNDSLQTASFAVPQPFTVTCVAQLTATTAAQSLYGFNSAGRYLSRNNGTPNIWRINAGSPLLDINESLLPGGTSVGNLIYTTVYNGASSVFRVNGQTLGSGTAGTAAVDRLTLARFDPTALFFWYGSIAEVALHSVALSTADVLPYKRTLGVRYGITIP